MQIVRPLGLTESDFTTTVPETDAPVWSGATTYATGDQVIRLHKVYVSTEDSNQNNPPENENQELVTAKWLEIGATNAFKFIDGTIANKTVSASDVTIDVANVAGADSIVFVGMKCSTIQVEAFDNTPATVFSQVYTMSGRDVFNYYQWFTEPIGAAKMKLAVSGIPATATDMTLTVTGTDVEIGEVVIGDALEIGNALYDGTEGEVRSFTRFEFNAYGELRRIKGPTRNVMRYRVHVPAIAFPSVKSNMDRLAGDVVAAIGSANRQTTIQVGVLGTIRWSENLPNDYIATFQVDGVI